jgi:hypothetical protein
MALLGDTAGENMAAAVRVYPLIAWAAKAAGWLAGNPWLAGGEEKLEGRLLKVEWRGNTWTVRTEGFRWPAESKGAPSSPALAWMRTEIGGDEERKWLSVQRQGEDLVVTSGTQVDAQIPLHSTLASTDLPLLLARWDSSGAACSVLAVVGGLDGRLDSMPPSTVFSRGEGRAWKLPGESLFEFLGAEIFESRLGGWELRASSSELGEKAADILQRVRVLDREGMEGGWDLAVWLDLQEARLVVTELDRLFSSLPIELREEGRRWRLMVLASEIWKDYDGVTLLWAEREGVLSARVYRRRPLPLRFDSQH